MKTTIQIALAFLLAGVASAQQADISGVIMGGERPSIAIPDLRGAGGAAAHMDALNKALWDDIEDSGLFKMASKSMYPLRAPQRPEDFRQPTPWLTEWSNAPVNAKYLAFGYSAEQGGQLLLFGWLFDVTQTQVQGAQLLGKVYYGPVTAEGARKVAHEFAADILKQFGGLTLLGSKVYFVSNRTGDKEIWGMEYDGSGQKPFTGYKTITTMPSVSMDGSRISFTSYIKGSPSIVVHSLESGRRLPFYNQNASMNAQASFTPDGKSVVYSSSATGVAQIYIAGVDGSGLRRISSGRAIEVEPKVNPKTGNVIVFVSGRSGPQQIYKMNIDGADVERLTPGDGQASNPSWHPDGRHIAFSWTQGYAPGNFNVFLMDVATGKYLQLTHGAGRNENPSWAPDGRHIVFASNRSGSMQIWSMLADGTQLRQLTTQGRNEMPVWAKPQG